MIFKFLGFFGTKKISMTLNSKFISRILIITLGMLTIESNGQEGFGFRGIGEACVEKSSWSNQNTCDEKRGFSCQNFPEYGGNV